MAAALFYTITPVSIMPRQLLHRVQAEAANLAEYLTVAATVLDSPDIFTDLGDHLPLPSFIDDEVEDFMMNDHIVPEILQLAAFSWADFAMSLTGEGSRGPYNSWPKSHEFFTVALQSPDRWFRHMFRFVYLYQNLLSMANKLID